MSQLLPLFFLGKILERVLGFFLKRIKEEVDSFKKTNTRTQIDITRCIERIKVLEKLTEDRREDVRKLYDILSKKG